MKSTFAASLVVAFSLLSISGCAKKDKNMKLSSTASEDVSHFLVTPESASGEFDFDAPRDYLPDPNIDWVVNIDFSQAIARERIGKALDIPWQEDHGLPTIFGFAPEEGHWTYVSSADAPASVEKLKLAWSLWDSGGCISGWKDS